MKLYTFRILSAEDTDFVRDIKITEEHSFYDLHMAIQAACDYDFTQMTSFFLSDEDWDKGEEISMMKMDEDDSIEDSPYYMKDVLLKDLIKKDNQRLLYLFDFFSVRMMFVELLNTVEIKESNKKQSYPLCSLSEGIAPEMIIIDDNFDMNDMDLDDEFEDELFDDDFDGNFENIDDFDL